MTLQLTDEQKISLDRWFAAYVDMYNETIKYFRVCYRLKKKPEMNWMRVRTDILMSAKTKIIAASAVEKKQRIQSHIIDGAIKKACSNYQAAVTNKMKGNITHFRLRYWKHNKDVKILYVEKISITKKTIFPTLLGEEVKCFRDDLPFDLKVIAEKTSDSHCDCELHKINNEYFLIASEKIQRQINEKKNLISMDPGVKTFMTGISNEEIIKIGDGIDQRLKYYVQKIYRVKTLKNISVKHRKLILIRLRRKLKNIVTELHWKTIKYLTENYKTILIGDLSAKSATSRKKKGANKRNKEMLLSISLFQFKQRLQYKCKLNGCLYSEVDEHYTSQACSCCGQRYDIKASRVYSCKNCKMVTDRDVNAAKNIFFSHLI